MPYLVRRQEQYTLGVAAGLKGLAFRYQIRYF